MSPKREKKATSSPNVTNLVLLTGATGFLGFHTVKDLVEKKYHVRCAVRNIESDKVMELRKIDDVGNRISFVECNLKEEQCWDKAVSGCDYVIHAASPFDMNMSEEEMVETAVQGTRNVLNACVKHRKNIKKIVFTSSIAAVMVGHSKKDCKRNVFTENDFSIEENSHGYELSKLLAEVEAHNIINAANDNGRDDPKIPMDVICPGLMFGPIMSESHITQSQSSKYMIMIAENKGKLGADLRNPLVDVRDAARAHVLAMEHEDSGNRYICVSDHHSASSLKNVSLILRGAIDGKCRYRPASHFMWKPVCKLMALFHPDIKPAKYWISNPAKCSNQRSKDVLGMEYRHIESSVIEHFLSLLQYGMDPRGFPQREVDSYRPY